MRFRNPCSGHSSHSAAGTGSSAVEGLQEVGGVGHGASAGDCAAQVSSYITKGGVRLLSRRRGGGL